MTRQCGGLGDSSAPCSAGLRPEWGGNTPAQEESETEELLSPNFSKSIKSLWPTEAWPQEAPWALTAGP